MDEKSNQNYHYNLRVDRELQKNLIKFWNKYQNHLIMAVVCICILIIGFQGIKFYKSHQIRKLQDSYIEAKLDGKELEFAEEHAMEPLSGLIWLKSGDDSYSKKQYTQAMEYYKKSVKALHKTLLKGRGRMGVAMTMIVTGGRRHWKRTAIRASSRQTSYGGYSRTGCVSVSLNFFRGQGL